MRVHSIIKTSWLSYRPGIIFLFLISFISFLNCNKTPPPEKNVIVEKLHEASNFWSVDTFALPGIFSEFYSFRITNNLLFAHNNTAIFCFNGKKWAKFFDNEWLKISYVSVNNNNLLICGENIKNPSGNKIIWGKLQNKEDELKVTKIIELPYLFSEGVYGAKFVNGREIFVLGLQEFEIVEVNRDEITGVKHYPLEINPAANLSLHLKSDSGATLFVSKDSVYFFNDSSAAPKISPLLGFPDPLLTHDNIEYPYELISFEGDINFGISKRKDKFYIYEKVGSQYVSYRVDSLKLVTGEWISSTSINHYSVINKNNICVLLKNGDVLINIPGGSNFNNLWRIIYQFKFGKIDIAGYKDSTQIFFTSPPYLFSLKIEPKHNREQPIEYVKARGVFYCKSYEKSSSIYGSAVNDFDGDGIEDFYLVDMIDINCYYPNAGKQLNSKYLTNYASKFGLAGKEIKEKWSNSKFTFDLGLSVGDIDESGSEDIIITNLEGNNFAMLNNGLAYFRNSSDELNLNIDMHRSESAALADVNGDGYLDIFFTSYLYTNRLFINNKGINFSEKTDPYRLTSNWGSISSAFGDINNDGLPDLYVANWMKENKLYLNSGKGYFKDITSKSGASCGSLKRSNSVVFADFDNDGDLDIFVGNRDHPNNLLLNRGNLIFDDISQSAGFSKPYRTYGVICADFNNDGWIDIFITDVGSPHLFINKGLKNNAPVFEDETSLSIPNLPWLYSEGKGAVALDYNNNGALDILLGQYKSAIICYTNFNTANNYIRVKIEGSESNRSGIGTKLKLIFNDTVLAYREVSSNSGYAAAGSRIQQFGLGRRTGNFIVEAEFPKSEIVRRFSVKNNSIITISEHEGLTRYYFIAKKILIKFLFGSDFRSQLIKFFIFLILFFAFLASAKTGFVKQKITIVPRALSQKKSTFFQISLSAYLLSIFIIETVYFFFPDSVGWINSTRNYFVRDAVPLLNAIIVIPLYLLKIKNRRIAANDDFNPLKDLLQKIQSFHHGESSAMNLNRISLYFKNLPSIGNNNPALLERLNDVIDEFILATSKDIESISGMLLQMGNDAKFSDISSTLILKSKEFSRINKELETLLNSFVKSTGKNLKMEDISLYQKNVAQSVDEIKTNMQFIIKLFESKISTPIIHLLAHIEKKYCRPNKKHYSISISYPSNDVRAVIPFGEAEKVISNLIQNSIEAFDFENRAMNKIEINTTKTASDFYVYIKDNGCGIKEEDQLKIFATGFTTKPGGHGFGLHWIAQTLNTYGGSITFKSTCGEGTEFIMRFKVF